MKMQPAGVGATGSGARAFSPRVRSGATSIEGDKARGTRTSFSQRRPTHDDSPYQPYFVTTRIKKTHPPLAKIARGIAVEELGRQRDVCGFLVLAYAFMPDHAHLVLVPAPGFAIEQTVRVIKGAIARRLNAHLGRTGALWQSGFWDKTPRTLDELNEYIRYTEMNPVRAGLSSNVGGYQYASSQGECMGDYQSFFKLEQGWR